MALRRQGVNWLALGLLSCAMLSPNGAMAYSDQSVKPCSRSDQPQTLAAEGAALRRRLPRVYSSFEISPQQGNVLRMIVPAGSVADIKKHVPTNEILQIWMAVLGENHPGCAYGFVSVHFETPHGKEGLGVDADL